MKSNKKVFIFVLICIIIFSIFYYIFCILGNNKNRNQNEIVDNILKKLENYEADVTVSVMTNKNETIYNMKQIYNKNESKTIINSPENIKGMVIENTNNTLKITNPIINMEKVYEDYDFILNNDLFLNVFINDYKNNSSEIHEQDNELILSIKLNNKTSTYIKYKELYLNKETKLPLKLEMKDDSQKTKICIIYNDIKIK